MNITEDALLGYITTFMWPYIRISGMFIAIPVFSVNGVPSTVRLLLSLVITAVIMPTLPAMPAIDLFSADGWLVTMQQLALGLCAGFLLQIVFSFMLFAGQTIAYSMGLGFATMVDPTSGVQVPVMAQLFILTSSLLFLSVDGHLVLIELLAQSFHTLPVGALGIDKTDLWRIVSWGSQLFAGGVLLSLPITAALLFVNVSFGVAAKAAPQLQIFGIGMPISILLGMVLIWVGMPRLLDVFAEMLQEGFLQISQLLRLQ
jgi:flagellar biosynthetic protein FliR